MATVAEKAQGDLIAHIDKRIGRHLAASIILEPHGSSKMNSSGQCSVAQVILDLGCQGQCPIAVRSACSVWHRMLQALGSIVPTQ
jgi:hypothetical protein